MKYVKIQAGLLALAGTLLLTGCLGGDSDTRRGRTSSRGRFSIGRNKNRDLAKADRKRGAGDIDDFSPEGSMERDLKRLREREMAQEKMLRDMRGNLDQRSDLVRREEEKLQEIRRRIDSYDTAIQRYEMASKSRPPREAAGEPSVVPREMFEERGTSSVAYGSGADDYYTPESPYSSAPRREARTLYSAEAKPSTANAPVREYRSDGAGTYSPPSAGFTAYDYEPAPEYEQVLYSAPVESQPATSARVLASPGIIPPKRKVADSQPFGGAPVGRSNAASRKSMQAKQNASEEWLPPGSLYSDKSTPTVVPQYGASRTSREPDDADIRLDQEVRTKAAAAASSRQYSAMSAPASSSGTAVPKTEIKMQNTAPQPSARKALPESPAASLEDEVFTPDLFLSGS